MEEKEEEEKMKLHLFWWLTNDFEMRVDLVRRQNHFPNNTAWSLNKQNWDTVLTWRKDGLLSCDTNNPPDHVGLYVSLHVCRECKSAEHTEIYVKFCFFFKLCGTETYSLSRILKIVNIYKSV